MEMSLKMKDRRCRLPMMMRTKVSALLDMLVLRPCWLDH